MCGSEIEQPKGWQVDQLSQEPQLDTALGDDLEVIETLESKPETETEKELERVDGFDLVAEVQVGTPTVTESFLQERQSPLMVVLAIGVFLVVCLLGFLVLQNPATASLALLPTATKVPPTITITPTWTPLPTETLPPSDTPTITPTPLPSDTPQPPRTHAVAIGENLFSLSLRYGVTMDSISEANGLPAGSGIQVSQQLIVPWPTATPPLEPVEVEIAGETVLADPTNCQMYEIKGGDTFFGIVARERIELQALMAVNRLTEQSVLQPGDLICIPAIIRGGAIPPTPGPSPTPAPTEPPPGPHLLYPIAGAEVDPPEGPLFLQWAAVKDLDELEWYMVEVTDLTETDSHPRRGFTRQNSFLVPSSWRPQVPVEQTFRWRVRIVQVTGERVDGNFIYAFGGSNSEDAVFTWLGAFPTPTPTPTSTPTPHPE